MTNIPGIRLKRSFGNGLLLPMSIESADTHTQLELGLLDSCDQEQSSF